MTMNYPVAVGNASGLSEFPWYSLYQQDWRMMASRVAMQQALNTAGRRLYLVGQRLMSGNPKQEDSTRVELNYMTLLATGFEMIDARLPQDKQDVFTYCAPYLQAAWEIRNRTIELAGLRWGLDTGHFRQVDDMPQTFREEGARTLVAHLDPGEILRALDAATRCFFAQVRALESRLGVALAGDLETRMEWYLNLSDGLS